MSLNISITSSGFELAVNSIKSIPGAITKAKTRALRRALESMRAETVRQTQQVYYVKAGAVRKSIKLTQVNNDSGLFRVSGTRRNVANFRMSPSHQVKHPKGLRVSVRRDGGMKFIRRGWAMDVNRIGKAIGFVRFGPTRKDIKPIVSLAIPQMMNNPDIQNAIIERGQDAFIKSFKFWTGQHQEVSS